MILKVMDFSCLVPERDNGISSIPGAHTMMNCPGLVSASHSKEILLVLLLIFLQSLIMTTSLMCNTYHAFD